MANALTQMKMTKRLIRCVLFAILLAPGTARAQDEVVYYHTDAIGSVRMITGANGAVIERYDFLPFGERWAPPLIPDPNTRQFAGKERDAETDLDYFGARYFRAQSGRFTTIDPVMDSDAALADPQRWNRYTYALNNPLKFTDPDGRNPQLAILLQRIADAAQRAASNPSVQRAQQGIVNQGSRAWVALTNLFNTPAGHDVLQTAAELASGADSGPSTLPTIGLPTRAAARAALADLGDVGDAANRFFRGATPKSTNFGITSLADGVRRLEFFSPANNPGYGKRYVQEIDRLGRIVREYKETLGPDGVREVKWIHGEPRQ